MPSKFEDTMSEDNGAEYDGEQSGYVPRVIYTADAVPDMARMQVDQLRVAQGLTGEVTERKASIGQYVLSHFPAVDEVMIVPLAAQNIRSYKPDPKKAPQCQAPTGTFGIGDPGGVCAECPLSKWRPRNPKTGSPTPPPCKEGISVRAFSITHHTIVDFQFMGGSVPSGTFIQRQSLAYGFGGFAVKMTSRRVENNLGTWYVPVLEMVPSGIPEEERELSDRWYAAVVASMAPTSAEGLAAIGEGSMSG